MRVIITGAGGFIGTHLVTDQLNKGNYVTALDINTDSLLGMSSNKNLRIVKGSILSEDLLDPFVKYNDICFHLASAHLEKNMSADYFWKTNVYGTELLISKCMKYDVKRFIHCSSVGVYGKLKTLPANEETPCNPNIAYESTKLEGEKKVLDFVDKYGFDATVLRPAWVYGPGCRRTFNLISTIAKNKFFYVGSGNNFRHPIYIKDMIDAFNICSAHSKVLGEIFIIAGQSPVKIVDLVNTIANIQNTKRPWIKVPFIFARTCISLLEIISKIQNKEPKFSKRSLKFFSESASFDISKAQRLLGFEPKFSLREGLFETINSYQSS
jgi:nucleoside-diphosphate-sugar epimerase